MFKNPIFHLRAKTKSHVSAEGEESSAALFITTIEKLCIMEKSKIIRVARYKLTLAKGCFTFDKTGEGKKRKAYFQIHGSIPIGHNSFLQLLKSSL